ncbi:MAG: hypothetical protein OEW32_15145, partial [Nitrospira sp.]|nr:hypothetical protein [Nitrospira sp.]
VEFCNQLGLDYVSCSPFRVAIARLASAQAAIAEASATSATSKKPMAARTKAVKSTRVSTSSSKRGKPARKTSVGSRKKR